MPTPPLSRRRFLRATGQLTAATALTGFGFPQKSTRSAAPSLKTSCVSWCFHGFTAGIDPEPIIAKVADLGFDAIELMVVQPDDLTALWTEQKIRSVRRKLAEHKLEVAALVPFFTTIADLGSTDPAAVKSALANFETCCRIAKQLGTTRLEIIAPYVSEFTTGAGRLGNPSFLYKLDKFQPGDKITLASPEAIDWDGIWRRMVGVLRECLKRTRAQGLELLVEPHFHSIIPDTATFLLMAGELNDPTFKLTTDTGWGTQQCEYPPMTVYRTQRHLRIVQFRDVDAQTRKFVPFGEGVNDNAAVLRALKAVNFNGYVSFEEVFMPTAEADARRFVQTMRAAVGK